MTEKTATVGVKEGNRARKSASLQRFCYFGGIWTCLCYFPGMGRILNTFMTGATMG